MTGPLLISVEVPGKPIGQGRISSLGRGRAKHSNADDLLPWRHAIAWHTRQAMAARGLAEPTTGPLHLFAVFTLPRPKSAPKRRWAPDSRPDLDHLVRALCDGITASGAVVDDGQFVSFTASKRYERDGYLQGVQFFIEHATTPSDDLARTA